MDPYLEDCVQAVVTAISSLGLEDIESNPARIYDRDVPVVREDDLLPFIIASPGDLQQGEGDLFDHFNMIRTYPVQVSLVDVSNRSDKRGRDLFQLWKETVWNHFDSKQPWPISHPLLFRVDTRVGVPIERGAWRLHFNLAILFVLIQLEHELGTAGLGID